MDGLNMWNSLSEDLESPRNLMLHNYDVKRNTQAVRVGDWKYIKGKGQLQGKAEFRHKRIWHFTSLSFSF